MIATLPFAFEQVGCVKLTIGALGVAGCDPIVPVVAVEIQPELFFAVIL